MLALLIVLALPLQRGPPSTIQPQTVTSPSGEWSLFVDPTSKFGDGPSHVAVSREGQLAWEADVPFTFWRALIGDAGHAAGYAFTAGSPDWEDEGDVVVAIYAPDGRSLLEEHHPRTSSRFLHSTGNPNPRGLYVQPALDRFVVRVADEDVNRCDEEWWTYRLSTGEALGRSQPKHQLGAPEPLRSAVDARAIPGTPLTLVQWYRYDWRTDESPGTRFVLVDEAWTPVWTLELARDYEHADEAEQDRRREEAWARGGIVDASGSQRFELHQVAEEVRVTYEVEADAHVDGGWTVREVTRAPWVVAKPAELPVQVLRTLATIPLAADAPLVGPIHDIEAFDFDAAGNPRVVRREDAPRGSMLLALDARGAVIRQAGVDELAPDVEGMRAWHALAGDRWLFTLSLFGDETPSRAWIVDGPTGRADEIAGFDGPGVEAVRPMQDGGFAVLGTYSHQYSLTPALLRFDVAGRRLWQIADEGDDGHPSRLRSCEDLAVEADGSLLVLGAVGSAVQVFDADGGFVRRVSVAASGVDDQSYLSTLRVEPGGHWLIHDAHADVWLRVDREGRSLGSLVPRRADGDVGSPGAVHLDAAGRLWGTDGDALFEFDEAGVAHTRFGAPPDPDTLGRPVHVEIDGRGRLAAIDRRSHAVHVFAPNGVRELVLEPDSDDFDDSDATLAAVVRAPDGRVYVQPGGREDRYLEFAADGRRAGWTPLGGECIAFVPGSGERWAAQGSEYKPVTVRRLNPSGAEMMRFDRRPNREFFISVLAMGCGPDGALSILSGSSYRSGGLALDVLTPAGTPRQSIDLEHAPGRYWNTISHGRDWIVVSCFTREAILISLPDGRPSLFRFTEVAEDTSCAFGLSPDGTELWCATLEPLELHRFALPR